MTEPDDRDVAGQPRPFHSHPYIDELDPLGGAGHLHHDGGEPHYHHEVEPRRLLAEHAIRQLPPVPPRSSSIAPLVHKAAATIAVCALVAFVAGMLLALAETDGWLRAVVAAAIATTGGGYLWRELYVDERRRR